jgi:hypothetical protein
MLAIYYLMINALRQIRISRWGYSDYENFRKNLTLGPRYIYASGMYTIIVRLNLI